ncbi:hypothetical protein HDU93_008633, partial [Gonapodya sp. JEL0774]
ISDGLDGLRKERSTYNFYVMMNHVTKTFYLFGKHIIGFYVNYLRFTNALSPTDIRWIYLTSLSGSFSVTIAIFLHTLRFKGYLPGWVAYSIYATSFFTGGVPFLVNGYRWATEHPWVLLITIGGILLNRIPRSNRYFDVYQIFVLTLFHWGVVNKGGSWSDVGDTLHKGVGWVVRDGFIEGKWVDMAAATTNLIKGAAAYILANPAGVAGKMWT